MASKRKSGSAPLKPVEFLVLAILKDGPLHGYGIVQEMASRTDGRISPRPGDLYRVLYRLDKKGLLAPDDRKTSCQEERRTCYRITQLGRTVLVSEAEFLKKMAAEALTGRGGRLAEAT
jgi:DNA-binding PadR family transcriptional regulator